MKIKGFKYLLALIVFNIVFSNNINAQVGDSVKHNITLTGHEYGKISANPLKAEYGEQVVLSEKAYPGYTFVEWEDVLGNIGRIVNNKFTMPDSDVKINAVYMTNQYEAMVRGGYGSEMYNFNEKVYIEAIVPKGKEFDKWYSASVKFANPNNPKTTFVMPADHVIVEAFFKDAKEYNITLTGSEYGNISANPKKAKANHEVVLSQKAYPGYTFIEWEDVLGNVGKIVNNKFTMPKGDVKINAVYSTNKYEVMIRGGYGSEMYFYKEKVSIEAIIPDGMEFDKWYSGSVKLANPNNPKTTFIMPADHVIVEAFFKEKEKYQITLTGQEYGNVSASHKEANVGELITLHYKPNDGFEFKEWEDVLGNVKKIENNQFKMPKGDVKINGVFTKVDDDFKVIVVNGKGSDVYKVDEMVTIEAIVTKGLKFDYWESDDIELENKNDVKTTFIMPNNDVRVVAHFTKRRLSSDNLKQIVLLTTGTVMASSGLIYYLIKKRKLTK